MVVAKNFSMNLPKNTHNPTGITQSSHTDRTQFYTKSCAMAVQWLCDACRIV